MKIKLFLLPIELKGDWARNLYPTINMYQRTNIESKRLVELRD